MKYFKKVTVVLLIFQLATLSTIGQTPALSLKIAENGKSEYKILAAGEAQQDSIAILVFKKYFKKITGINLPVSTKPSSKDKLIIFNGGNYNLLNSPKSIDLKEQGFQLMAHGQNLTFTALDGYGLESAVYYFLEKYLACRYFSPDCQVFPQMKTVEIPEFIYRYNPPFNFRLIHYANAYDSGYARWHRLQNSKAGEISSDWGLWVHTMHRLVPPEKYFANHPEYYALRNAVRVKDQLCLSNPDVLAITIDSLREKMKRNPNALYWSVSQMDNYNFCQCDRCRMIDSIEGSPSGSIINFVNMVAMQFPDKIISTLAYQYSRKPPLFTRPAPNVNIMFCSIECDRSKAISRDQSAGSFVDDLKNWSDISNNILVWDYVINFSHLDAPFPNFYVLQPNIKAFAENHVSMMFEQGYSGNSGEMNELRCYLLAKYLNDPSLDTDTLIRDFLSGYYGTASGFIYEYIKTETEALFQSGKTLTLYEPPAVHADGYLSPALLEKYFSILDSALVAVKDDSVLSHRVSMVLQSVRYAWLEVCKYQVFTKDWIFEKNASGSFLLKKRTSDILEDFCKTANKYGPLILHENGLSPDEYYIQMKQYFENALVANLASGKKISFAKPYAPQYAGNGINSLIDGVRGTEDYQLLWQGWWGDDVVAVIDMQNQQKISALQFGCLDDNQSWIMAPESFKVEVSADGKIFSQAGFLKNNQAGEQLKKQIIRFDLPLKVPLYGRFIRITIKNTGKLPAWRGVDGKAWIFLDEIVIK